RHRRGSHVQGRPGCPALRLGVFHPTVLAFRQPVLAATPASATTAAMITKSVAAKTIMIATPVLPGGGRCGLAGAHLSRLRHGPSLAGAGTGGWPRSEERRVG